MKAFDLGKFGKALQKANSNIQIGFTDPKIWISTGNYCLNYAVSGDFHKGFRLVCTYQVFGRFGQCFCVYQIIAGKGAKS